MKGRANERNNRGATTPEAISRRACGSTRSGKADHKEKDSARQRDCRTRSTVEAERRRRRGRCWRGAAKPGRKAYAHKIGELQSRAHDWRRRDRSASLPRWSGDEREGYRERISGGWQPDQLLHALSN